MGEPVRVSVCHCRDCQRRSGSVFAAQARWPADQVTVTGLVRQWETTGDSGIPGRFNFCPTCGSTVFYIHQSLPDLIAVAIGAFADPGFPAPQYSVREERRHAWVQLIGPMEHHD